MRAVDVRREEEVSAVDEGRNEGVKGVPERRGVAEVNVVSD